MARFISEIAEEIREHWPKVYFDVPTDKYGRDDGKSIVLYFLSNATSWRGDTARRIKAELREMVK